MYRSIAKSIELDWLILHLGLIMYRSCTDHLHIIPSAQDSSFKLDICAPDLYGLYDLAHVAGWESYILRGVAHVSWV